MTHFVRLLAVAGGTLAAGHADAAADPAPRPGAGDRPSVVLVHGAFDAAVRVAAWRTRPSWYVASTRDHVIAPELQRALAQRIGAHVTPLPTSHVPQEAEPAKGAAVILDAVQHAR